MLTDYTIGKWPNSWMITIHGKPFKEFPYIVDQNQIMTESDALNEALQYLINITYDEGYNDGREYEYNYEN